MGVGESVPAKNCALPTTQVCVKLPPAYNRLPVKKEGYNLRSGILTPSRLVRLLPKERRPP